MKKFIGILLTILIFFTISIYAESPTLLNIRDFEWKFNYAATLTGSGHKITKDNLTFTSGTVNDIFTIQLDKNLGMNVTVPHQKSDINGITLIYVPDGDIVSVTSFVAGIGELALTFGAVKEAKSVDAFIENLGLFDTDFSAGSKGYVVIKGIRYSWQALESLGIWFHVLPAE